MNTLRYHSLALLSVISLLILPLNGCDESNAIETVEVVRPVKAQQIMFDTATQRDSYAGEVEARYITDLGFRVSGKIVERKVDVGDSVKANQVLARIDATDYRLSVSSSRARVNAAQADFTKAQADLKRYKSLKDRGVISAREFDQYQATYNTTAAGLKEAKALLDVDENRTRYTELVADKAGVVTAVLAEVGEVVGEGEPVVRVARPEEKEIAISIPEHRLDAVKQADYLQVSLWAAPEQQYKGQIREIAPSADPLTRTYQAKIKLLNPDDKVHLGMTATVTLARHSEQPVAKLPLTALYSRDGQASVWVFEPESQQVQLQNIAVAEFQDNHVLVTQGLQSGQWVVTAGAHKLYQGQKVRLMDHS